MASTGGVDINTIKEVLGHTDIRTTQNYAHVGIMAQGACFRHKLKTVPKVSPTERDKKKVISIRGSDSHTLPPVDTTKT